MAAMESLQVEFDSLTAAHQSAQQQSCILHDDCCQLQVSQFALSVDLPSLLARDSGLAICAVAPDPLLVAPSTFSCVHESC